MTLRCEQCCDERDRDVKAEKVPIRKARETVAQDRRWTGAAAVVMMKRC
jgi:hypothetical protein